LSLLEEENEDDKILIQTSGFSRIIPYNRLVLLTSFHFVSSNVPQSKNKKLNKVQPVFVYISRKFSDVYTPTQNFAADESLILWERRLGIVHFVRIKRARFGTEIYIQSEYGYIWNMMIYCGKVTELRGGGGSVEI
jgi:hypothetical protein